MPSAKVKIKYSSSGGNPTSITVISVPVSSKKPTESEISAYIKKQHPKWNFIIIEIN